MGSRQLLQGVLNRLSQLSEEQIVGHFLAVIESSNSELSIRKIHLECLLEHVQNTDIERLNEDSIERIRQKLKDMLAKDDAVFALELKLKFAKVAAKAFCVDADNGAKAISDVVNYLQSVNRPKEAFMLLGESKNNGTIVDDQVYCKVVAQGLKLAAWDNHFLATNKSTFFAKLKSIAISSNTRAENIGEFGNLLLSIGNIFGTFEHTDLEAFVSICFTMMRRRVAAKTELKFKLLTPVLTAALKMPNVVSINLKDRLSYVIEIVAKMGKTLIAKNATETWNSINSSNVLTHVRDLGLIFGEEKVANEVITKLAKIMIHGGNTGTKCAFFAMLACVGKAGLNRKISFPSTVTGPLFEYCSTQTLPMVKGTILIALSNLVTHGDVTAASKLGRLLLTELSNDESEIEIRKASSLALWNFCANAPLNDVLNCEDVNSMLFTYLREILHNMSDGLCNTENRDIFKLSMESIEIIAERSPNSLAKVYSKLMLPLLYICDPEENKFLDEQDTLCRSLALRSASKLCLAVHPLDDMGKAKDAKKLLKVADVYRARILPNTGKTSLAFMNSSTIRGSLLQSWKSIFLVVRKDGLWSKRRSIINALQMLLDNEDKANQLAAADALTTLAFTCGFLSEHDMTNDNPPAKQLLTKPWILRCLSVASTCITDTSPLVHLQSGIEIWKRSFQFPSFIELTDFLGFEKNLQKLLLTDDSSINGEAVKAYHSMSASHIPQIKDACQVRLNDLLNVTKKASWAEELDHLVFETAAAVYASDNSVENILLDYWMEIQDLTSPESGLSGERIGRILEISHKFEGQVPPVLVQQFMDYRQLMQ